MKLIIYFCILAGLLCCIICDNKDSTKDTRNSYIATIYAIVILHLINTVAKYI